MGNVITAASTGTIVYKNYTMSQALQLVATSQESALNTIQECANTLRRDILTLEKTPLNTSSVDTIIYEGGGVNTRQYKTIFSSESYTVEMRGQLVKTH